jgi:TetR/AcrR family transcriptional regulator, cholesterol catabolism regulator
VPQPAPVESKRARNQAARRERVIGAAVELASDGGYEAVQMRDVAERADVALGTLYRYFPSKDALLIAALFEMADDLKRRMAVYPARGETPAERVTEVLRRACRALERQPNVTGALVTALSSPDPTVADSKLEIHELLHGIVTDAMDGAQPRRQAHAGSAGARHDGVVRVLGNVWFGALVARSAGMAGSGQMGDDLEEAARLLLERARTR